MLTDRQQKFYRRISELSDSDVTDAERENLKRTNKWLDRGDDFRVAINSLCLGLKSLESERLQGELSSEVKSLLEDLIEAYGEPEKREVEVVWPNSMLGLERGVTSSSIRGFLSYAIIVILLITSFVFWPKLILHIGYIGTIIFYAAALLLAVVLASISGKKKMKQQDIAEDLFENTAVSGVESSMLKETVGVILFLVLFV